MAQSDGTTLVVRSQSLDASDPREDVRVIAASGGTLGDGPVLATLGDGAPDATAALRVIRHRLQLLRSQGMWTIGVTSARGGEGKTTLATQLALVLSEAQRARVLLVEASMHRPALARLLGLDVPAGLAFSVQSRSA